MYKAQASHSLHIPYIEYHAWVYVIYIENYSVQRPAE